MIICGDLRCKYRNNKGKCTCKKVIISAWSIHTTNMSLKDMHECKSFEFDEEYLKLKEKVNNLFFKGGKDE